MYGFITVKQERLIIQDTLLKVTHIKNWLGKPITENSDKSLTIEEECLNGIKQLHIFIKEIDNSSIIWNCKSEKIQFSIQFAIEKLKIHVEFSKEQNSILLYLQDWIYLFYRLKELIEEKKITLPNLQYKKEKNYNLDLVINIISSPEKIYTRLTEKPYISQIFSKYPECNLDDFTYSWGWIEEGPSNLISWVRNSILIYDFMVDFNFIGYVKWELIKVSENLTKLHLVHKDLDLENEVNLEYAYFSYRNGWLYFMTKVKDLSENKSFSIHFENEIVD